MERGHVLREEEFQATGGGCRTGGGGGGGDRAAQAGLNETGITTSIKRSSFHATCQRINSLNSSLSVLGLSSLDWPQPAEQFQRKVSGICREKRWIGRV